MGGRDEVWVVVLAVGGADEAGHAATGQYGRQDASAGLRPDEFLDLRGGWSSA